MTAAVGRRLLADYIGTGLLVAVVVGSGIAVTRLTEDSEPVLSASHHHRGGAPVLLSEVVATAGLLFVIVSLVRTSRTQHVAWAVGAWIGAAYWVTASTSFANPAVTIGRTLTSTYAGIAPVSVPAFIAAQLVGGTIGTVLAVTVYPARPARARADEPAPLAG